MIIDIDKMTEKTYKSKKEFKLIIEKDCKFIIKDFTEARKKIKFKETEYILYDCKVIELNSKIPIPKKYILQLPIKTAWLQLSEFLKENNKLYDKDLHIYVNKINNYHYDYKFFN